MSQTLPNKTYSFKEQFSGLQLVQDSIKSVKNQAFDYHYCHVLQGNIHWRFENLSLNCYVRNDLDLKTYSTISTFLDLSAYLLNFLS